MEQTAQSAGTQSSERRRAERAPVAGVAVLQNGTQPPSVWRVSNLSTGGAGLVGDGTLGTDRLSLCLHLAGFPMLELAAKVVRRQVLARGGGRCAVKFLDLTPQQLRALRDMAAAGQAPAKVRRRALLVTPDETRAGALGGELARLGFAVRREPSAGQAAAWLQYEETEVLLVDERVLEAERWSMLQFVHDTSPETRRLVIANDVRGFRLYYAIKAGLVEGLVEPNAASEALVRHITGAPAAVKAPRARAAR
jgi:hypothetical protein